MDTSGLAVMFEIIRDPVSALYAVEQGGLGSSRAYTSLFVTGVRLHGFSQHHATFFVILTCRSGGSTTTNT